MRLVLACPACRRRYDATGRRPGSRYRCSCGGVLAVPETAGAHDAAVVRCSSCGAPRSGQEMDCRYCGSDFTLHERDLDTLCPECMARVSGKARFCHFCATPLLLSQAAAAASEHPCPACGSAVLLASRRLGSADAAVLECRRCAGLWVEKEVFEVLAGKARTGKVPDLPAAVAPGAADARVGEDGVPLASQPVAGNGAAKPLYRPCAVCGSLMNRRNYGQRSGVILDVCRAHGIWFDAEELQRLLGWIRAGGEEKAQALRDEQQRTAERQQKLFPVSWPADEDEDLRRRTDFLLLDLLGGMLGGLFRSIFH
jgi:Zn-finger nucleic acid-binding protein